MKKIITFLILLSFFWACTDDSNDQEPQPSNNMDDLNVPDGFGYKTTKTVNLEINMPPEVDFDKNKTRFNVYGSAELNQDKLITSGSFSQNGHYTGSITIPYALNEIYLQTVAGDKVVNINGNQKNGVIIDFGDDYGYAEPDTTEPAYKSGQFKNTYSHFTMKTIGTNVIGNGDFSDNDFGTIAHWDTDHPADEKWYLTNYWMGKMQWENDGGNSYIKTPLNNNYYGGASQWIVAEAGDVITFSADIKADGSGSQYAYLYLIPRNSAGNYLRFYYVRYFFPSDEWVNKTVVASMPSGTEYCQVLIWNNDYSNNGSIYYDNVFVTGPVTDADGDGVSDENDDYPDDAERAFKIYYPGEEEYASLAFEDNWPGKGDYDFNDMVIDYNFLEVVNSNNELVDMDAEYRFIAAGATLINGFGFEMDLAPSDISNVTGTSLVDGYINTMANGTEAGQDKATIIVTDNIFTQLPHPGGGIGVNTSPGETYVTPTTLNISLSTTDPVSLSEAGRPPYNPFMIVDQIRGREVHLPDQPPTALANQSYFGTEHDDSNPATGKYYMTENNLPWGINLPEHFDYPVEKAEIISAYLHFAAWAESAGNVYEDWYTNESGYRNEGNIYQVPQ